MRRIAAAGFVLSSLLAVGLSLRAAGQTASSAAAPSQDATSPSPPTPTFNKDVAPILYANCVVCHRPGEVAPMSLLTFADARPWARSIKTRLLNHEMPPWYADPKSADFANRPKISQAQIDTLVAWTDAGAPEGSGTPPAAPTFRDE